MKDIATKLITILPSIKTRIQLTGLIVLVSAVLVVRFVAPESITAQVSAGAIGVCFIVFGQAFQFLDKIPDIERAKYILRLFFGFLAFIIILILVTTVSLTGVFRQSYDATENDKANRIAHLDGELNRRLSVFAAKLGNEYLVNAYAELIGPNTGKDHLCAVILDLSQLVPVQQRNELTSAYSHCNKLEPIIAKIIKTHAKEDESTLYIGRVPSVFSLILDTLHAFNLERWNHPLSPAFSGSLAIRFAPSKPIIVADDTIAIRFAPSKPIIVADDTIAELRVLWDKLLPHFLFPIAWRDPGDNPKPEAYAIDPSGALSNISVSEDDNASIIIYRIRDRLARNRADIRRAAIGAVVSTITKDGSVIESLKVAFESPSAEDCNAFLFPINPIAPKQIVKDLEKQDNSFPVFRRDIGEPDKVECGGSIFKPNDKIFKIEASQKGLS